VILDKKQKHLNLEYITGIVLLTLNVIFYKYFKYTVEVREALIQCLAIFIIFLFTFNIPYLKRFRSILYTLSHISQITVWTYLPINANYDILSMTVYIGAIIAVASGFLQINSRAVFFYPLTIFLSLFLLRNFEMIMASSIFSLCTVVILGFRYFLRKQKQVLSSDATFKNTMEQSRDYFFHTLLNPLNILHGKIQLAEINKLDAFTSKSEISENLLRIRESVEKFNIDDPIFKEHKNEKDLFLYGEYRSLKKILSSILCFILILSLVFFRGFSADRSSDSLIHLIFLSLPLVFYVLSIHLSRFKSEFLPPIFILIFEFFFFFKGSEVVSPHFIFLCKLGIGLICIHIYSFYGRKWFFIGALLTGLYFLAFWGLPYSLISLSFSCYISLMCWLELAHEEHLITLSIELKCRTTPNEFLEKLKAQIFPKLLNMEKVVRDMNKENAERSILELKSMAKSLSELIKE